jgi:hypothetical protein
MPASEKFPGERYTEDLPKDARMASPSRPFGAVREIQGVRAHAGVLENYVVGNGDRAVADQGPWLALIDPHIKALVGHLDSIDPLKRYWPPRSARSSESQSGRANTFHPSTYGPNSLRWPESTDRERNSAPAVR